VAVYTQGDRGTFTTIVPKLPAVVCDTRGIGVNQEKYILSRVDPRAPTRQNAAIARRTPSSSDMRSRMAACWTSGAAMEQ